MKNKRKGFTLIELLVVVVIIAILAAIALPQYQKAVNKSRVAEAKITLKNMENARQVYKLHHGTEPANFAELDLSFTDKDGNLATGTSFETKDFYYSFPKDDVVCPGEEERPMYAMGQFPPGVMLSYCKDVLYCHSGCLESGFTKAAGSGCGSGGYDCYVE